MILQSGDGPTTVTTTVRDYDLSQASAAVRSVLMGCAFVSRQHLFPLEIKSRSFPVPVSASQMAFMHLYMKYTQPLFIQGIMPLKSLFDAKVSFSLFVLSFRARVLNASLSLVPSRSSRSTCSVNPLLAISSDPLKLPLACSEVELPLRMRLRLRRPLSRPRRRLRRTSR